MLFRLITLLFLAHLVLRLLSWRSRVGAEQKLLGLDGSKVATVTFV